VRVPEEVATGVAQAQLTFEACKVFDVAPQTVQLQIEPKPQPKAEKASESEPKDDKAAESEPKDDKVAESE